MVVPSAPKSQRSSERGFSTQSLVTILLGSFLLVLVFVAGILFNEISHHNTPLSPNTNLRGSLKSEAPDELSAVAADPNSQQSKDLTQEFFTPDTTKHNQNKWGKITKRPDDWKEWGFGDVHHAFECSKHAHDQTKPMPTMEYWNYYRDTYKHVVDNNIEFDSVPPTEGYTMNEDGKQPYYAKISPGKGRGLFASRAIKKGELVHDGTKSDIEFSANDWRKMAFALPQKMACDFAEWTWTQPTERGGPYKLFTAFNISILMNSSTNPNTMPKNKYHTKMYATRDINKDEEILTDYNIYPTKWEKVGLSS